MFNNDIFSELLTSIVCPPSMVHIRYVQHHCNFAHSQLNCANAHGQTPGRYVQIRERVLALIKPNQIALKFANRPAYELHKHWENVDPNKHAYDQYPLELSLIYDRRHT